MPSQIRIVLQDTGSRLSLYAIQCISEAFISIRRSGTRAASGRGFHDVVIRGIESERERTLAEKPAVGLSRSWCAMKPVAWNLSTSWRA